MKKNFYTLILLLFTLGIFAQTPQAFKYQAIIRNGEGELVVNQNVGIQLSILEGSDSGNVVYTEAWDVQTNNFGLVTLSVGKGLTSDDFASINWGTNLYYLQVAVDVSGGTDYTIMGASQLLSVPYALYSNESGNGSSQWKNNESTIYYNDGNVGVGTTTPSGRLVIKAAPDAASDSVLFEVKDKDGIPLMTITSEGVKIYVKDDSKGVAGGFAVGRYAAAKGDIDTTFLLVTPDSTRVYTVPNSKGVAGGFAVGRYAAAKGGATNKYFFTGIDSTRIYLNENTKGVAGGFAVGRYAAAKGDEVDYFNINTSTTPEVINPSEARILWYPLKEAFLTGRVLIESEDSVGLNSWASGFESKSIGDYSQALGYKARAFGDNSTAIGNFANAVDSGSYAIGSGAIALGLRSFALGSTGVDSFGIATLQTKALGDYSYAFGMGSVASNKGAFAIGTENVASGYFAMAIGYKNISDGLYSTAFGGKTVAGGWYSTSGGVGSEATGWASVGIGDRCIAEGEGTVALGIHSKATMEGGFCAGVNSTSVGHCSVAIGEECVASSDYSIALGANNASKGATSVSIGANLISKSYNEFVIGRYNDTIISTDGSHWIDTEPLFLIGNGTNSANRHNAVTVLKNGNFGVNTNAPDKAFTVEGDARVTGSIFYGAIGSTTEYDKPDFVFEPEYKKDFKISEVEQFIKINKHLPWVTSAKDEKEGINMTRLSFETLEAIENQQLQIIKLNNELKKKDKTIIELKKEIKAMNNRLKEIEDVLKSK
ncbi:MAG: hypothetical protein GXO49_00650 [Chlorobi bacterium]|nr:hypothetical protein [Chlorobiota bacterium]